MLIAVLFTASIAFSQTNEEYKAQIESLNREMVKAMLEGNTEKIMSLYTDDAISMPSYEAMHDGIAAIRQANAQMEKSGMKCISFEPTTLKVMVDRSLITEIGTYKFSMKIPGMDAPMDDHGKSITIWEVQRDGSLKVKVDT